MLVKSKPGVSGETGPYAYCVYIAFRRYRPLKSAGRPTGGDFYANRDAIPTYFPGPGDGLPQQFAPSPKNKGGVELCINAH